jgi:hypothetical protein
MHTWRIGDTTFTGNSDLSGDLTIASGQDGGEVRIPAADALSFAADFVRSARIEALEQREGNHLAEISRLEEMADHEVLGMPERQGAA